MKLVAVADYASNSAWALVLMPAKARMGAHSRVAFCLLVPWEIEIAVAPFGVRANFAKMLVDALLQFHELIVI